MLQLSPPILRNRFPAAGKPPKPASGAVGAVPAGTSLRLVGMGNLKEQGSKVKKPDSLMEANLPLQVRDTGHGRAAGPTGSSKALCQPACCLGKRICMRGSGCEAKHVGSTAC